MTTTSPPLPPPEDTVLATLNDDGSRRWLRPKLAKGRYWVRRRIVAWVLIAMFTITPFLRWGGKPLFQFDVANRRFTFFATTFHADETLALALVIVASFLSIFLITALAGRAWCGWACPQTVYMEFLYRPIERLFEGRHYTTNGRAPLPAWRRIGKYAVFLVVSFHLANTFLAWFVGTDTLYAWSRQSPFEHPAPFLLVAAVTGAMMIDFCFFREQMCTLACPYGRLQSVLLDRSSLIVGYDERRGEPRGKKRKGDGDSALGDCVDCNLCVAVCPTGIDIRDGLQMECIHCTQCADACDHVMEKVGREPGLIRYGSQAGFAGEGQSGARPRVVLYPAMILGLLVALTYVLVNRQEAEIEFLRSLGTPYEVLEDGNVSGLVHFKVTNRTDEDKSFGLRMLTEGDLLAPGLPLEVPAQSTNDARVFVVLSPDRFEGGRAAAEFELLEGERVIATKSHNLLGPLFGPKKP
jgi:cytochrome c oxidase accessory protein FixG